MLLHKTILVPTMLAALATCWLSDAALSAPKDGKPTGPAYDLVTLAPPGIEIAGSNAYDLNEEGNVVGYYDSAGNSFGFYFDLSQQHWLLFGSGIKILGLNNDGEMVGVDENTGEGLYWRTPNDQNPVSLSPLPGHQTSLGLGINDAGIIIGHSAGGGAFAAVAWAVDDAGVASAPVALPWLVGDTRGSVPDLNETDNDGVTQIAGYSGLEQPDEVAVRWEVTTVQGAPVLVSGPTDLGSLAGGTSAAYGINFLGDIVGSSGAWPFLKPAGQPMQPLAGIRKATNGTASDIHDGGVIVGSQGYLSRGVPVFRAVLWTSVNSVTDLNQKVSLGTNEVLEDATRINNAGHILGSGFFPGITNARNVGFLLVPRP